MSSKLCHCGKNYTDIQLKAHCIMNFNLQKKSRLSPDHMKR